MKSVLAFATAAALLIVALPARAADDAATQARVIEVNGDGEAHATPDIANLSFEIEIHAPTAEQAAARNAALADKVMTVLKSKVGEKGKVQTGGYSLNPDYSQRPGREQPVIIGYNAQNSITVETPDLKGVGALIDAAVAAGANRINYLNFSLKDDARARADAIAIASRNAQTQAQALASALGVKLKRVIKATTVAQVRPIFARESFAAPMAAQAATPVEPGQVSVPATVTLTYEIE